MTATNTPWQLEDFIDSLVIELDKTRETLAVKAINKPLSYTVKEVALDLNIFPSYDGDQVKFLTAQPGQEGASKVTIQLGSITDQQVRATTKTPGSKSEINLEEIEVDKATKKQLRKLGVNSVEDLQQIEKKNIDIQKVSDNIDYRKLANQIQKSKRAKKPPRVTAASLSLDENRVPYLLIEGENLGGTDPGFRPVAVVNQALAEILSCSDSEVKIQIGRDHHLSETNELILTFDPYTLMKVNVKVQP
jgi:hypothetical protein